MNTKLILASTAILFAAVGICLTFAPDNIITLFGMNNSGVLSLILQLIGAAYYAFAMLNWMAKGALIGGIYNRPIATANFTHFLIAGLALTKAVTTNHHLPVVLSIMAGVYMIMAGVFGYLISRHPGTTTAEFTGTKAKTNTVL
jgi:hypothetical protein